MLKAVIFDLNGVFIQGEKLSKKFERDFGISSEQFLPELSRILEIGRRPGAENMFNYWKPVLEKWDIALNEKEFFDYWFKSEKLNPEMIVLAQELKHKNLKLIILSNNFKERSEYYGHYTWIDSIFDKVYFSWKTGFVKPDPRAWEKALEEMNLNPEDCVYFDDQKKNLKVAESIGIKSFMFVDESTTRKILESLS